MSRETVSYTDGHIYEFSPDLDPVYTAADGESLTFETIDSLNKEIQEDDDLLESIPEEVNAATGPVAVEGAEPGDVLAVEIESVEVNEDRGRVVTAPGFGLLQEHDDIEHPFTRITPVDDDADTVEFDGIDVPIRPVIGTIGVATESETISTLSPHDHGGNLDTTDMTAGTTAYFPVFQEGGLLAMGDSKAAMADGEMCGTGAEIGTDVDVTVSVVKQPEPSIDRPLVRTPDAWKTVASADTMEEAVELANRDLIRLLAADHDMSPTEAYTFSSLVGGLEISQVVDPLVTVRNACPAEYLSVPF
ncbi:acetamidase/formamidase family protein [Candidatus Halobonum tyrrellensis]|uniref:Acetamidase/formamidase n=1 Tax=Candidatus Halobonum tyrrellensis G22 TaxID=1324957 RepID=V4HDB2_9EURY|nr:acetamidase/formamidase family protein [Candidatus Halobonum tyrrellensis]ESP88705.1 acetamidase/formamidase [Candidatus Halobonum tyrrellensis G22]